MKKKTSPKKKAAPKKKKSKVLYADKCTITYSPITYRFLNATQREGARHMVRVVTDCSSVHKMFDTIQELNDFLFQFDQENYNKNPVETGTWIDLIITNIYGEVFDLDQLEEVNEDPSQVAL